MPYVVSSPLSESKTSDQAIEVRLGPQGVKAKYVRVELRKIETIPGVPPNSYYDFVGQSPVNLWRSSEEYSMLHSVRRIMTFFFLPILLLALTLQQDIPFYIRIPESIPPTLALENGGTFHLTTFPCIP